MASSDFLVRLSSFVEDAWPNMRIGHSIHGVDDRYPCANPEGPVDNSECPEDNPLCNCPCQELNPYVPSSNIDIPWYVDPLTAGLMNLAQGIFGDDGVTEPTDEEIQEALEGCKECDRIESELGSSYLGCLWNNASHPSSCDCPCVGENFKDYVEYTRTYATYWDTKKETPLWRNAEMFLMNSQQAVVVLNGDLSLRPGALINIENKMPGAEEPNTRRFSGRWLVTGINHIISGMNHKMTVSLSRDSNPLDPNESEELGWFETIGDWLFG